jgi:hypothetical protein
MKASDARNIAPKTMNAATSGLAHWIRKERETPRGLSYPPIA